MKKILILCAIIATATPAKAGFFDTSPSFYWGTWNGAIALFTRNFDPLVFGGNGGDDGGASAGGDGPGGDGPGGDGPGGDGPGGDGPGGDGPGGDGPGGDGPGGSDD